MTRPTAHSQAVGIARLMATARQQAGMAQTKMLPRCPSFTPADQFAQLEAEVSEMPAPLRWKVLPVLALVRLSRRLLNGRGRPRTETGAARRLWTI